MSSGAIAELLLVRPTVTPVTVADQGVTSGVATGFRNNAEGGTNGVAATLANSGGASGTAFTNGGPPPTILYDNAHVAHGTLAYKFASGGNAKFGWGPATLGSLTDGYGRACVYLDALPPITDSIIDGLGSATLRWSIQVTSTGKIAVVDTNSTQQAISSTSVSAGSFFRVEFHHSSTSELVVRIYLTIDGTTPDETITAAANTAAVVDTVRFGHVNTTNNVWIDDLNAAATTWPGPAVGGNDTIVANIRRAQVSDTGTTPSDTVARVVPRGVSDTGATITDTGSPTVIRQVTDVGVSPASQVYLTDTFARTVGSGGWGTADSGTGWATPATGPTAFSVSGNAGRIAYTSGSFRIYAGQSRADFDGLFSFSFPVAAATTNSMQLLFNMRAQAGTSDALRGQILLATNGNLDVQVQSLVGGTATPSGFGSARVAGGTYVANEKWWCRCQLIGSTVRARIWKDGTAEPTSWTPTTWTTVTAPGYGIDAGTVTDATALGWTTGDFGFFASIGAGNSAGTLTVDDVTVSDPNAVADTVSVTVSHPIQRAVSDTGTTPSDAVQRVVVRAVSDQGATITDTVQRVIARPGVTDTGNTTTDVIARSANRQVADTGSTITDALRVNPVRGPTDTGTTTTDSIAPTRNRAVAVDDTGTTTTDSLRRLVTRQVADTGTAPSDSVTRTATRAIADTGSTITDTLNRIVARPGVTDTGASVTDSVAAGRTYVRTVQDSAFGTIADPFSGSSASGLADLPSYAWAYNTGKATWTEGSGVGVQSDTTAVTRLAQLPIHNADGDHYLDFMWDTAPTGANQIVRLVARCQSTVTASDCYKAQVTMTTAGTGQILLQTSIGGTATTMTGAGALTVTITPGVWYRLHMNLTGYTVSANVWQRDQSEPAGWQRQSTDAAQNFATGLGMGVQLQRVAGNTNLSNLSIDNLSFMPGMWDIVGYQLNIAARPNDTGTTTTDTLTRTVARAVIDTGSTITDTLSRVVTRPGVSDTGTSVTDTLTRTVARQVADVGTTPSDSVSATYTAGSTTTTRNISDTGTTPSDTLTRAVARQVSDAGATISDTLTRRVNRAITDTGTTTTDTLARAVARQVTDTGAIITDAIRRAITRLVSDTGTTPSDTVAPTRLRSIAVSDTGTTPSDTVAATRLRAVTVSDTGTTPSDSLTRAATRAVSDQGATITDALRRAITRAVTDTGTTTTDTLTRPAVARQVADTGATITDALRLATTRQVTDTGAVITDTLARVIARQVADTGAVITDTLAPRATRQVTDTGTTPSDTVTRPAVTRQVSDTGTTTTDLVGTGGQVQRGVSDTGTTTTDTLRPAVTRQVADTGTTTTDAVAVLITRPGIADVGVTNRLLTYDTFTRTVAAGLGTDPSGQAYSTYNGTGSSTAFHSVNGSQALASVTATNSRRSFLLTGAPQTADADVQVTFTLQAIPTGASNFYELVARAVSPSDGYQLRLTQTTTGVLNLTIQRRVANGATQVGGVTIVTSVAAAGDTVTMRLVIRGGDTPSFDSYFWKATPPATPQATTTDATPITGVGWAGFSVSANSGSTSIPFTQVFDNFSLQTYPNDSVTATPNRVRQVSDTGTTPSDAIRPVTIRAVSDQGASISDSLRLALVRAVTDTGTTPSDTISGGRSFTRAISDQGTTTTDATRRSITRQVSDQGTTTTDSLRLATLRAVADQGTTTTDAVARSTGRLVAVSDTGTATTDTLSRAITRRVTDTGTTPSDTVTRTIRLGVAVSDTGTTPSDVVSLTSGNTRGISDIGTIPSDTVATTRGRAIAVSDTGTTITDAVTRNVRINRAITDTGTTTTDSIVRSAAGQRDVSDQGATITDTPTVTLGRAITITDVGATITDAVTPAPARSVTDQGTTTTDTIALTKVFIGPHAEPFDQGTTTTDYVTVTRKRFHPISDVGPHTGIFTNATRVEGLGSSPRGSIGSTGPTVRRRPARVQAQITDQGTTYH